MPSTTLYRVKVGELWVSKQDLPFLFKTSATVTLTNREEEAMKYTRRDNAIQVAMLCGVDTIEQINIQTVETITKETLHVGEEIVAETETE